MENSPLNKAHQLERHAEALLKHKKFDECMETYKESIKYLTESLLLTENPYARDSIQLQIDANQKQIDRIEFKKRQHEHKQRYFDNMKQKVYINGESEDGDCIQNAIFYAIETHDSLVELLFKHKHESIQDKALDACDGLDRISGKKHEVDDSTIIEEFKELSGKLRELVQALVLQVEERDLEIAKLKQEIARLEGEKSKGQSKNTNLKVVTDSSGGTSPFVFSPCCELSPEVHDSRTLPSLTPLEMPNIDIAALINKRDSNNF